MDKRETPPHWLAVMEPRGIHSAVQLSERSGVAVQTVIRLIHNEGGVTRQTLDKVGAVLKLSSTELMALRGVGDPWRTPFTLPAEADLLDDTERDVIRRMVKVLLRRHTEPAAAPAEEPASTRELDESDPKSYARAGRKKTRPTVRELLDAQDDPA